MLTKTLQPHRSRTPRRADKGDLAGLARTAVPIALVGLVNLAMSVTDAILMADLEPQALTAGMVVGDLYSIVNGFAAGALGAVAAPVAVAHAAGDAGKVGRTIAEGLHLALVLAVLGAAVIALAPDIFLALGIELPLPGVAAEYAGYMAATYAVMTIFALSRSIFPAFGGSRVVVVVIAAAVPLNFVCDLVLMHGWFGIPAMGLAGAGAASLVVAVFMALTLLAYMATASQLRDAGIAGALLASVRGLPPVALARAGLFTGATALSETGVFLSSTFIVAFVAIEAMPSHIVVFRTLAVTYVIGTGFSQAVTIHFARRLSAADATALRQLRRAAIQGMGILALAFLAAMIALPGAGTLAGFDTGPILALAPWAAIAVCGLVSSVVAFGILKARVDVGVPSLIGFAGYWGVGFCLMSVLVGGMGLGVAGIWAALAGGTAASAAGLWIYLWRREATRVAGPARRPGGAHRPTPA